MPAPSRVPPAWVLSLPIATFGMTTGFGIVILPQMLAALGVPGGRIAASVAVVTSPTVWAFLLAPLLDVRFRRRSYALAFGLLAVLAPAATVLEHASAPAMVALMTVGFAAVVLYGSAVGGWTGALIGPEQTSGLGAWNAVVVIGSDGLGVLLSGYFTQHLSSARAAPLVLALFLAPMLSFLFIPAPPPDATLARESFLRFARGVAALLRRREILLALTLFALPCASFALTNVLGGWGADFHTRPALVSFFGGVGAIVAGAVGSLLVPLLARRIALRRLYLAIGLAGAGFTLSLLLLPRAPAAYGLAFLGENVFQAAAFAASFAITYEVIGKGNPLAATIYALLTTASNLPIVYMEVIDGRGFDWRGVTGAFLADALVSGAVCVSLWIVFFRLLRVPDLRPGAERPAAATSA
jgi:PAT family beta-lactamase induction signal transducer AmpG